MTLKQLDQAIDNLTIPEQLRILKKVIYRLQKPKQSIKKELDWNKLYGSGKELWKGVDAQNYVNRFRNER